MEFSILKGRDPLAMETIRFKAERYVMSHKGCGQQHYKAYIAGAMDMLKAINHQTSLSL